MLLSNVFSFIISLYTYSTTNSYPQSHSIFPFQGLGNKKGVILPLNFVSDKLEIHNGI